MVDTSQCRQTLHSNIISVEPNGVRKNEAGNDVLDPVDSTTTSPTKQDSIEDLHVTVE